MKKKIKSVSKTRVLMAMSGGVDSSVVAKLLVDQGYEVVGIFLHFWKEPNTSNSFYQNGISQGGYSNFENKCCSTEAFMDARRVCNKIGIPLYTFNFSKIFKKQVVDNFLSEYKVGKTPNPCVRCNKLVKLGYLIKQAKKLGFDYVATGHYSKKLKVESLKLVENSKLKVKSLKSVKNSELKVKYKLYKAKDEKKDQSYFLYTFSQDELGYLLFPLGDYTKQQVRLLAKKFKLPVAEKKESQEICFISEKSHNEFLKRHIKLKSGDIKTLDNKIIGKHQGLPLYTIGQRKGIDIGGNGPFYAAKTDYKTNTLYVVNDNNDPALFSNQLIIDNVNWLSEQAPKFPLNCQAVIRYHHKAVECVVSNLKNKKNNLLVKFIQPQRAITPGQSVVFYKKEEAIGGGIIC
ncbi:tRNA 2-thiouridine(34) synthase MnmA [Patescibacteria group bacterium]|nr:tRNA 2-thiouridine(34) synthase MnmA [Patescibacteria group bacterium]MBU0879380.1 tRNA 2-thiouridine(34) synthase MnmA [Patescibacteria group bacterium]MBU0880442.1 tRNA 2-thiouridine(34) synthase MnmA [Patescibacteria group bacterium]MBU0897745.1 tRNA 2-thiouridine(34) synthase MnmA [Patescibacteria group bacterium]MBU1783594.1 tRNA 2-thiouridine(34) synthase MnmA [Patescibacteria group bacterium]